MTESLTTDLSRIRGLAWSAAIRRSHTKASPRLKKIGRELNVRYVLEGSVQRGANRMRVNVQLIDAETGNHLWAERFDKPLADLFDMQDEIVARLASALNAPARRRRGATRRTGPEPRLDGPLFSGFGVFNKGRAPANVARARSFFDRALTADPDNVDALIGSARVDVIEGANFLSPIPRPPTRRRKRNRPQPCRRSRTMRLATCC